MRRLLVVATIVWR